MVVMFFVNIVKGLLLGAIELFGVITLPTQMISALATITGYGAFIIGSDLLLIFATVVTFWFTVKCTIGLIVFVWKLLPLT